MLFLVLAIAWSSTSAQEVPALASPPAATPVPTSTVRLEAGEYLWMPEMAPAGPVVLVISLPEQLLHVYRNGVRIGVSTVSTGKASHETPTGVFSILQKRKEHYSNLYNNAPMPYMQRLTWDGIALHAGKLPGYPASHGCVRLPFDFSQKLYAVTANGMTVVVADEASHAPDVSYPGWFAPVDPATGAARGQSIGFGADGPGNYSWHPDRAADGALTLVLSLADQEMVVMRNGIEIGRASVATRGGPVPGTHVYVLLEGEEPTPSTVVPDRPGRRWLKVASLGDGDGIGQDVTVESALGNGGLQLPPAFANDVYEALQPGATVVVTGESMRGRTPADLTVIRADEDPAAPAPAEN